MKAIIDAKSKTTIKGKSAATGPAKPQSKDATARVKPVAKQNMAVKAGTSAEAQMDDNTQTAPLEKKRKRVAEVEDQE